MSKDKTHVRVTGTFTVHMEGVGKNYKLTAAIDTDDGMIAVGHSECKGAGLITFTKRELQVVNAIQNAARQITGAAMGDAYYGMDDDDD